MEGLQLTFTKDTVCFKARHFFYPEVGFAGTNIHKCFDFKARRVDMKVRKAAPPEGIVAIAEIGKLNLEAGIGKEIDASVAKSAYPGKISAASIIDIT